MGKKGLGGIKKLKTFTSCHGGVVGCPKLVDQARFPAGPRAFFFSGFQSEKKGLSKNTKDVQPLLWWCSGQGSGAQGSGAQGSGAQSLRR